MSMRTLGKVESKHLAVYFLSQKLSTFSKRNFLAKCVCPTKNKYIN